MTPQPEMLSPSARSPSMPGFTAPVVTSPTVYSRVQSPDAPVTSSEAATSTLARRARRLMKLSPVLPAAVLQL